MSRSPPANRLPSTAAYENWRQEDVTAAEQRRRARASPASAGTAIPARLCVTRTRCATPATRCVFHHRNRDDKLLFDYTIRQQGLEAVKDQIVNTQKGRTFGGMMSGEGFVAAGTTEGKYLRTPFKAWHLKSARPGTRHHLRMVIARGADRQPEGLAGRAGGAGQGGASRRWTRPARSARQWWADFWKRSRIVIHPGKVDADDQRVADRPQLPVVPLPARLQCLRRLPDQIQRRELHLRSRRWWSKEHAIWTRTGGPGAAAVSPRRTNGWCTGRC